MVKKNRLFLYWLIGPQSIGRNGFSLMKSRTNNRRAGENLSSSPTLARRTITCGNLQRGVWELADYQLDFEYLKTAF